MKIWHLEKEYDAFIAAITSAREERKAGVRNKVQAIRAEVLEKGEAALIAYARQFDGWTQDYPLKVSRDELEAGRLDSWKRRRARAQGDDRERDPLSPEPEATSADLQETGPESRRAARARGEGPCLRARRKSALPVKPCDGGGTGPYRGRQGNLRNHACPRTEASTPISPPPPCSSILRASTG